MSATNELGPWAARRFALLTANPGGPPSDPDAVTTPNEDVPGPAATVLQERLGALGSATAELDAFAQRVDSSALVVLHHGELVHEWYADGSDRETLRPSQSMHKSLVGAVVLRCVEEGLLPGVDASASRWLPEWAGDERAAITIDHLLRMESGLAQYGFSMDPTTPDFLWLFGDDTTPHVLAIAAARPPGEAFEYNNLNSQALGVLLERATGERYAALLSRLVWEPMGAATGKVWLDSERGQAATSCCLSARAYDWALFGEVLRTRGSVAGRAVLSEDVVDTLTEPSPRSAEYARQIWLGDGMDAAMGTDAASGGLSPIGRMVAAEPFAEQGVVLACGFGGQRVYVARESGVVLVRMGHPNGTPAFTQHWDNTKLLNLAVRALAAS